MIGVVGTTLGAFVLVGARAHYTIDVAVGVVVALLVWTVYHILCGEIVLSELQKSKNPFWFFEKSLQGGPLNRLRDEETPAQPAAITDPVPTDAEAAVRVVPLECDKEI